MHGMNPVEAGDLGNGRRLINVKEAALRMNVSERHLRSEIASGRITHRRLGGRGGSGGCIRFLFPDDVLAYIDGTVAGPAAA
jgi:hypothetical protein